MLGNDMIHVGTSAGSFASVKSETARRNCSLSDSSVLAA